MEAKKEVNHLTMLVLRFSSIGSILKRVDRNVVSLRFFEVFNMLCHFPEHRAGFGHGFCKNQLEVVVECNVGDALGYSSPGHEASMLFVFLNQFSICAFLGFFTDEKKRGVSGSFLESFFLILISVVFDRCCEIIDSLSFNLNKSNYSKLTSSTIEFEIDN